MCIINFLKNIRIAYLFGEKKQKDKWDLPLIKLINQQFSFQFEMLNKDSKIKLNLTVMLLNFLEKY